MRGRRPGGASSARSWSTTPRRPRPGWPARREAADDGWPDAGALTGAGQRDRPGLRARAGARRSCCASRAAGRPRSRWPRPGQSPAEDEARLEAVRDALGPDGLVRIDANGGWSVDEAVARIPVLERAAGGLEYVEQPVAVGRGPRRSSGAASHVPIAADESIRRAEDPYRVRDLEAADIAVLKVQPLGGVRACLRIAEDIGLPVVVSSARRVEHRHRGRGRAGGGAARAALRLRSRDRAAAHRRRGRRAAAAGRRRPARTPARRSTRRGSSALRRLAGPGGALAPPDGRGRGRAAGSSLVTASSTDARHLAGRPSSSARGHDRRGAVPRARATRRSPSRCAGRRRGSRLHTRIDERTAALPRPRPGQGHRTGRSRW